ncbi:SDR family NAD(P)-dependent oxidoreductase [Candidatus Pseudothioglobus sp. Uisw_050_01]|uniref:SDR family NAD(P)-dependent oxidoreductase n=1 Tax=Candidatus Pseudothioglobus sp. Uisw_050_01 TaxID=3230997 RepID=UPI003A8A05AF
MSNFNFINKTVIISGGGSGIGYEIAKSFLQNGANVAILGRREEVLIDSVKKMTSEVNNSNNRVISIPCDLSQDDEVNEVFMKVIGHFKSIDIVINNCATWIIKPVNELSVIELDEQFNNIFKTTVLCTKYAAKNMKNQGVIINLGSFASVLPIKNSSIYSSLKSSIVTFTKSTASELGLKNIRVNCVIPGVIRTPMTSKYIDENYDRLIKPIALGRLGESSDIANSILFLSSDMASYITGTSLEVSGGKFSTQH